MQRRVNNVLSTVFRTLRKHQEVKFKMRKQYTLLPFQTNTSLLYITAVAQNHLLKMG